MLQKELHVLLWRQENQRIHHDYRGQQTFRSSDHSDSRGTLVPATLHFNQLLEIEAEKYFVLTQAKQKSMCARSSLWRLVG